MNIGIIKKIKDQRNIAYNQIYSIFSFLINLVISVVIIKLVTTYIDPENYGVYKYVLAVIGLCGITTITGINKTIGGYVAKNYHGTVKETTKLCIKTGVIGVIVLIIFGLYSFYIKDYLTEAILFFVAAVVFIPYVIFPRYQAILAGLYKFKDRFILQSVFLAAMLIGAIVVLVVFKKGILAYGISQMTIQTSCLIVFFILTYKKLSNNYVDEGFLKHSVIISLFGIGSHIITPGIQIYLNYTLGSSALAFYMIADSIRGVSSGAAKSIMSPIVMKLARKDKLEHSTAILKLIPLTLVFGLILYGCIFVCIHTLGSFIIDKQYNISLFYAKLLTLAIIFAPLYSLLRGNVLFEKNNRGYAITIYTGQALQFIGYVLFVNRFGIPAIAFTNFIATAVSTALMIYYIKDSC